MKTVIKNWQIALKDRRFAIWFLVILSLFVTTALFVRWFLVYNDTRMGASFDDPILKLFNPIDLTWPIFIIEHSAVVVGIYIMLKTPHQFSRWGLSYIFLLIVRTLTLWLVPLEPPPQMILLIDPIISIFVGANTPVKDLFFSGHTATAFLLYLGLQGHKYAKLYLLITIAVGIMIILQHAHYSIDVLVAPPFALLVYSMATRICKKLGFLNI
ncbi:MAG: hypothetical protein IPM57_03705 [Oligoflexia bacterium]|nr:hypothetical protein [Oligoflexia bacterium]